MQRIISFRLIISEVIMLLLCLCPSHVNAQGKTKLGETITKALNKTQRVLVPKSSRSFSELRIVPKVPTSVVVSASAAKLRETPDPSILNPSTTNKDLKIDVNSNISPLRHIDHHTRPNSSITTDISNEWWKQYIQDLIEDQMIQQGKEKTEQLFDNKRDSQPNEMEKLYKLIPIKHDIKQERDRNTSYIYYCAYGNELAA